MSLKPLLSFSSGELDPILFDNVTLEKFNKGLATARNVIIGKTGNILSRFSRRHLLKSKNNSQAIKIYSPVNKPNILLEFGPSYVRCHNILAGTYSEITGNAPSSVSGIQFLTSGDYVYVFVANSHPWKYKIDPSLNTISYSTYTSNFSIPSGPSAGGSATSSGTGYRVDYVVTIMIGGQESDTNGQVFTGASLKKPISSSESNVLTIKKNGTGTENITEFRIYSKPNAGGAYGYLGSTTSFSFSAGVWTATFEDIGASPDFTNGLPIQLGQNDVNNLSPMTGVIYQQRLIVGGFIYLYDQEAILASRPGFQNNFYRDFPYSADSALQFRAGSSGKAKVLRMLESDGLVVFTDIGTFVNAGILSIDNLALQKVGSWIIKEEVPPLVVPGGVFFVDRANIIRQLIFSQEIMAYESSEQTIFSNHLFKKRTITSWSFQDGIAPLIIVTFSDGSFATFTYNFEHQMRAWTRHDSTYAVEQVEGSNILDKTFFVVNKGGNRYIEYSVPRYASADDFATNTDSDKSPSDVMMDSMTFINTPLSIAAGETFTLTPVTPSVWDDELTLTVSALSTPFTAYDVGDIFRVFNPIDKSSIDFEVTAKADDTEVTVMPSDIVSTELQSFTRLYPTFNTITGLTYLEGESVVVVVDGSLVTSPNNDVEGYPTLTVSSESITLPDGERGAIIAIGRPFVADVKTLPITTVEQSPTLLESINVNKLYIRVNESRGLYCDNRFPEEATNDVDGSSVIGMDSLDEALIPAGDDLIGNKYLAPISKRIEKHIPGDWSNQGQIAIRQVDPYPFEIMSIIPDLEVQTRSNR